VKKVPENKDISDLINSLEFFFLDLIEILKSLSNDKRLQILIYLLTGEKKFDDLRERSHLAKTALSNHLSKLIKAKLIQKPEMGIYKLTDDGELFLRSIEATYLRSNIKQKRDTEALQQRKFSESFVESFFG
jgi:predicted transcriptional regulator